VGLEQEQEPEPDTKHEEARREEKEEEEEEAVQKEEKTFERNGIIDEKILERMNKLARLLKTKGVGRPANLGP
jgi:hypothetical protein